MARFRLAIHSAMNTASRGDPAPLTGQIACMIGASPGMTGSARGQDHLRLILRRTQTQVAPLSEVLVFQAHTKIIDGQLADEKTRQFLGRHLASFVEAVKAHRA